MRRRPDIRVALRPPVILPGVPMSARLSIVSTADTPCDGVVVDCVGTERRYQRTVSTGKSSYTQYHEADVVRLRATIDGFRLTPGTHERVASFPMPHGVPPSYESSLTTIAYELGVRVSIPWWPDRVATYRLVSVTPAYVGATARPTHVASHAAPEGKNLFIEASLGREDLALGSTLDGIVSFANVAHHRIRRIELALVAVETALVTSSAGPTDVARAAWTIHEGKPGESIEIPFRILVPTDMPPSFETAFIRVTHELRVFAKIAFGSDIHISIPVRLHRPMPDAPEAQAARAMLGKRKQRSNWELAARAVPGIRVVSFDEAKDEIVVEAGNVTVHLAAEHRGAEGPFLVAEIEWPSLGLGLRLTERSWHDLGDRAPGALAKRFSMQARERAQADALFVEPAAHAVLAFQNVGLDDTHAVVASPGSSHTASAITNVLQRAIALGAQVASANARMPPPSALASAVSAYAAFAGRRSARIRMADLALLGIPISDATASLEHRFEGATPRASTITVHLPPKPAIRDAVASAAGSIFDASASIVEAGVAIEIPLVTDPATIDGQVEALGDAVRAFDLRGAGPYR